MKDLTPQVCAYCKHYDFGYSEKDRRVVIRVCKLYGRMVARMMSCIGNNFEENK